MDDRELNEELARLCGIPTYTDEEAYGDTDGPGTVDVKWPFVCGGVLRHEVDDHLDCDWNPVKKWQQVHDFVIPALWRMGLSTCVHYEEDAFFARVQPFCRSWEVVVDTQEDKPSPRFVCLAALEAGKRLEETDAK